MKPPSRSKILAKNAKKWLVRLSLVAYFDRAFPHPIGYKLSPFTKPLQFLPHKFQGLPLHRFGIEQVHIGPRIQGKAKGKPRPGAKIPDPVDDFQSGRCY